eukprot:211818_1
MAISYGKRFIPNLFVDVDPSILKLEHGVMYDFEIAANDAGLSGFKVVNVRESIELDEGIFNRTYTSKLKEIDNVNRIAKLSIHSRLLDVYKEQFVRQKESMVRSSSWPQYICFAFSQSRGFSLTKLNNGCVLEYKIERNETYDVAEGSAFPFKAVGVRIPIPYYQWQRLSNDQWMSVSRDESMKHEDTYNKYHKEMQ